MLNLNQSSKYAIVSRRKIREQKYIHLYTYNTYVFDEEVAPLLPTTTTRRRVFGISQAEQLFDHCQTNIINTTREDGHWQSKYETSCNKSNYDFWQRGRRKRRFLFLSFSTLLVVCRLHSCAHACSGRVNHVVVVVHVHVTYVRADTKLTNGSCKAAAGTSTYLDEYFVTVYLI